MVVFHHLAMLTIDTLPYGSVPRKLFVLLTFAGHPAVIIFFVLSGFVLYINHVNRPERYLDYLVKRTFRIYPAFIATFSLVLIASLMFPIRWHVEAPKLALMRNISIPELSSWPRLLSLVFATSSDTRINVVFWSLVYEVRFSLLFPFMAILVLSRPRVMLATSMVVYVIARVWLASHGAQQPYILADRLDWSVAMTLIYLPIFLLGMLASHLFGRTSPPPIPSSLGVAGAATLLAAMLFVRDDLVMAIMATAVVYLCASEPVLRRALGAAGFRWLGRISYSLYLVHLPIMAFALFWTAGIIPPIFAAALAGAASIMLAWLGYEWVERPGIRAGRSVLTMASNSHFRRELLPRPKR